MYKLLIADDNEIICKGIASCIDWKSHDIEVVDIAFDGELALKGVESHEPDIVILDINMPFIDGIEAACAIRQNHPNIRIIMLTAYKEFEYAKKAIELQVFSYITKPFKNQDVLNAVIEAKKSICEEKQYRQQIRKNLDLIKEKQLSELVVYGIYEENTDMHYGIRCKDSYFVVGILYIKNICRQLVKNNFEQVPLNDEILVQMTANDVRKYLADYDNVQFFVRNNKIILLFELEHLEMEKEIFEFIKKMMKELVKDDNYFLSCGIGRIHKGIKSISHSYKEARKAIEYRYNFGNFSVFSIIDIPKLEKEQKVRFQVYKKNICNGVRENNIEFIQKNVKEFFNAIRQSAGLEIYYISFLSIELIISAYKSTEDEQLYEEFVKKSIGLFGKFIEASDISDIEELVNLTLSELYFYIKGKNTSELEIIVNRAVEYMNTKYDNPDLRLKEVADYVHISPSYLCALFKKYKGISYVNYLNKIRNEHAKKLLANNSIKTYEVAFLVGYNSSQYFSSSFKKYTGFTPTEYRNQIL